MLFKKIDSTSNNVVTSALGFFETPPSNVGIASSRYNELLTLNPVDSPPYHFKINPSSSFVDLAHIYLETEMHVEIYKDNRWKKLGAGEKIAPIQAIGATWIKNMRVSVNGRETFNANSLYAYKAYLDLELSYPTDVKENYLGVAGYYPVRMKADTYAGAEPEPDQNDESDLGYQRRRDLFLNGKTAQFYTKLNADIFSSDLYLINAVPIEIEIHPNSNEFLLLQNEGRLLQETGKPPPTGVPHRLVITSLKMYVRTVELMDGLALEIARYLETHPARYGIRRSELKSLYLSQGRYEFQANIFYEQIPRRIVIGFVEAVAFNGHFYKSPFVFGSYNADEVTIHVGGTTVPSVRYQLDYPNNRYMRAYHDMMEGVGFANTMETNGISPRMFKHGWAIYVFTLTADLNNEGFELIRSGSTSIYVHFGKPLVHGVNMVVYGELGESAACLETIHQTIALSDSLLMLDANRQLTSDMVVV